MRPGYKMTVPRDCGWCGRQFLSCASYINAGRGKFCSAACGNLSRRRSASMARIEVNSIPEPNSGCWLWLGAVNGDGYAAVRADGKNWHAHRLSYVLANGEPPDGRNVIRHLCNNPCCVNPDHLAAGTTADNAQDRVIAGTHIRGSSHKLAKLSEAMIPVIVAQHRAGVSQRALAARYGVNQRTIDFVLRGVTWKHVSGL